MRMIAAHARIAAINEPLIGAHLAPLWPEALGGRPMLLPDIVRDRPEYFFSDASRDVWERPLRELILGRLGAELGREPLAVVKEPNGAQGAPELMRLLPGSRMIFLLRDGRDVVDSELAAYQPGAWMAEVVGRRGAPDREELIAYSAAAWLARIESIGAAYAAHPPELRHRVRYEDLLAEPAEGLGAIFAWLGLEAPPEFVAAIAEAHSFERVEDKGALSFNRAASPGLWRENLSAGEQELVAEIIGPKLSELGYGG